MKEEILFRTPAKLLTKFHYLPKAMLYRKLHVWDLGYFTLYT